MRQIDDIFLNDRTCYSFSDQKVDISTLQQIYDICKLGPTSANTCPLRIIFVESKESREKLAKCVMEGNVSKIMSASCTAIFAYDMNFYEKMDKLYPHDKNMKKYMSSSDEVILDTARRNATLQASYFMMIARGFGVDVGPMSGFDKDAVSKAFLANTGYKVDFLCNLGYKESSSNYPKLPRLEFEEACSVI